MTKDELLAYLRELQTSSDSEQAHGAADDALLAYIADSEIAAAFESIERWYA